MTYVIAIGFTVDQQATLLKQDKLDGTPGYMVDGSDVSIRIKESGKIFVLAVKIRGGEGMCYNTGVQTVPRGFVYSPQSNILGEVRLLILGINPVTV